MSLQWTLIAGFLYVEIAVVLLLVLPVASPKKWNRLFKSRFMQSLQYQAGIYFLILIAILVLFLLDAIREMRKYSTLEAENDHKHLDAEMQGNMRLFRAQRNFYISGFALFLSLVIRRLVSLISSQAALLAQSEAAISQAKSATTTARSLLDQASKGKQEDGDKETAHNEAITEFKKIIKDLEGKLESSKKDKEALSTQSKNLSIEYDRLIEEHSKLQKKVTVSGGDKKDD